jgi:predicted aspartyl protease
MVLVFRYHSIPNVINQFKKPTIPVEFKLESGSYINIICLVDSGSDIIVLPKGIAELLNIKLEKESKSKGLGGEVKVSLGKLSYRIKGNHNYFNFDNIDIEILETDDAPVIFGRRGFFDKFKVTIDERNEKIILKEYDLTKH